MVHNIQLQLQWQTNRKSCIVRVLGVHLLSDLNLSKHFSRFYQLLLENHRSLIQICIISSLESTCRFIPSSSPVLSRFTSSSTYQHISLIIPALIIHHSFTLSLQAQNLLFQQILPTLDFFYLLDCLRIMGLDRTYHAHHFIFSFTHIFIHQSGSTKQRKNEHLTFIFLFILCGRLSWLSVSFLLHVKYTLSYRIVSSSTQTHSAVA